MFNLARTVTINVSLLIFSFFGPFVYNDSHDLRYGSATTVLAPNHAIPLSISPSLVFSGGLSFFFLLNSSSWMSCYISEDTTIPSTADRERERKVNPPTDWVCLPSFLSFCSVSIIYYTPHTPSLPAVVPHRLQPYPPTSLCSTSKTGQKANKKHLKKSTIPCFYMYISSSY